MRDLSQAQKGGSYPKNPILLRLRHAISIPKWIGTQFIQ
jgi:hypothetical protein